MGHWSKILLNFSLGCFLVLGPAQAWAQIPPPQEVPQNVTPGAVDSTLQKQFDQTQQAVQTLTPPADLEITSPTQDEKEVVFPQFKVEEIQLRGVTLLKQEDLESIIRPVIGQLVDERALKVMSQKITEIYHQRGFTTSKMFLPSQKITNGIVVLLAQENRLGKISVIGNHHTQTEWILSQISQKSGEVFNIAQLEKDLNTIKKSPKITSIRANIKPAEALNTSDMEIEVKDQLPFHLMGTVDNTGRETIGVTHYNTTLVHQDLWGLRHQGILSYTGASGIHSFIGQYQVPLNQTGWTAGIRGSMGKTLIGGPFDVIDLTGRSDSFAAYTNFPIIQKPNWSLTGDLSVNTKFSNTYVMDQRLEVLEQNIQSVTTGLTFQGGDKLGRWVVDHHWDFGFGAFAKFHKLSGSIQRTLKMPLGTLLLLQTEGQYSPDNLPGMEQFQIGGFSSVRGYQEGKLIADSGISWRAELHAPFWHFPDWVEKNMEWLAFFEGGYNHLSEKAELSTRGDPGSLWSYGLGLRARLNKYLSGRIDVGFAQRLDTDEPTGRVHFGLNATPF